MLRSTSKIKFVGVIFILACMCRVSNASDTDQFEDDIISNWDLAVQTWTFRQFTLFEAIDKAAAAGLKYVEVFPGQRISAEHGDANTHFNMSAQMRKVIKDRLDEKGVSIRAYGVVHPDQEQQWRNLFEFCKDMGIQTITSEPHPDQLDMVEQLCIAYDINLGIHNHPEPTRYWNPETVFELVKDRDKRVGVCADIGHWMRSGIDPLEALKMLGDRVNSLHMKDLNEFGSRDAHDVVWGTGKANVDKLLKQLYRQGFKGVISIEYEHNWDNNLPEVKKCVEHYNKVVSNLSNDK